MPEFQAKEVQSKKMRGYGAHDQSPWAKNKEQKERAQKEAQAKQKQSENADKQNRK